MPLLFTKKREPFKNADDLYGFLKSMPEGTTFHVAVYAYDSIEEQELAGERAMVRSEEHFSKKYAIMEYLNENRGYARTLKELSDLIEASDRTVRKYVAELASKEFLRKERSGKGGKLFFSITQKGIDALDTLNKKVAPKEEEVKEQNPEDMDW